jgi:hypothetical protein
LPEETLDLLNGLFRVHFADFSHLSVDFLNGGRPALGPGEA